MGSVIVFFIEVTITKLKLDSLTFSSVWLCALEELEPKLEKDRFVLVQVAKLVSPLKSVSLTQFLIDCIPLI